MTRDELLPLELLEKIPQLYSTEEISADKKIIWVKYFLANFTWLVTECETKDYGDVLFFGYVINHSDLDCSEWGYFTLWKLSCSDVSEWNEISILRNVSLVNI